MRFSKRFRDTFRDIFEKSVLALWLTLWALILHFAGFACAKAGLPAWIVLLFQFGFDVIIVADILTVTVLAVALLIRVVADTFKRGE